MYQYPLIDVLAILNYINITLHFYQDDKNEEDKELCSEHTLAIIVIAIMIPISSVIIVITTSINIKTQIRMTMTFALKSLRHRSVQFAKTRLRPCQFGLITLIFISNRHKPVQEGPGGSGSSIHLFHAQIWFVINISITHIYGHVIQS